MRTIIAFVLILAFLLIACNEQGAIEESSSYLVLINCNIVDANDGSINKNATIIINDDIIEEIGNDLDVSKYGYVIDLENRFVLPGWINAHVHDTDNEEQLKIWAQNGVTTVRDMNPRDKENFIAQRDSINKDNENSGLICTTPIITKPDGYGYEYIESPEEAKSIVLKYSKAGVDMIKISIEDNIQGKKWEMLSAEEISAITKTAHDNGLRVTAHISSAYNIQIALDGNVDELTHMIIEAIDDDTMQKIVDNDIYWSPTLELWQGVSEYYGLEYLKTAQKNLKSYYDMGGNVVFGTDFGGFFTPFEKEFPMAEVMLMKEAGMDNLSIIKSATVNAAYSSGVFDSIGSIETGKVADLIVVEDNPLEVIETLQEISMVIHRGELIKHNLSRLD